MLVARDLEAREVGTLVISESGERRVCQAVRVDGVGVRQLPCDRRAVGGRAVHARCRLRRERRHVRGRRGRREPATGRGSGLQPAAEPHFFFFFFFFFGRRRPSVRRCCRSAAPRSRGSAAGCRPLPRPVAGSASPATTAHMSAFATKSTARVHCPSADGPPVAWKLLDDADAVDPDRLADAPLAALADHERAYLPGPRGPARRAPRSPGPSPPSGVARD